MTIKTITVKKRGGGTRKQKVKVLKSGKFKFVKNSTSSRSSTTKRKTKSKRRKVTKVIKKVSRKRSMAKRKSKRSSSRKGFKVPFLSSPSVKKAAAGIGMASILSIGLSALGQQQLAQSPVVKIAGGFIGGDVPGAIGTLATSGGLNLLNLGGGGQATGQGM